MIKTIFVFVLLCFPLLASHDDTNELREEENDANTPRAQLNSKAEAMAVKIAKMGQEWKYSCLDPTSADTPRVESRKKIPVLIEQSID